jgi:hypothetical protein
MPTKHCLVARLEAPIFARLQAVVMPSTKNRKNIGMATMKGTSFQ